MTFATGEEECPKQTTLHNARRDGMGERAEEAGKNDPTTLPSSPAGISISFPMLVACVIYEKRESLGWWLVLVSLFLCTRCSFWVGLL